MKYRTFQSFRSQSPLQLRFWVRSIPLLVSSSSPPSLFKHHKLPTFFPVTVTPFPSYSTLISASVPCTILHTQNQDIILRKPSKIHSFTVVIKNQIFYRDHRPTSRKSPPSSPSPSYFTLEETENETVTLQGVSCGITLCRLI